MISAINYSINPAIVSLLADQFIEPTLNTPYVKYEKRSNYLVIKGTSTRDNMDHFYDRVMGEFKRNIKSKNTGVLHLNFKTFNTSTAKVLFDLFRYLRDAQYAGQRVAIQWDVYDSEPEMVDTARDFAELFDLKIKIK
ncbi:MAG: hypothetical protein CMB80_17495 [Flammeovirgaceae bacterium]|nr:hypothetical protein [Flammeovirgaceae bacterium]MBR07363.1 hypothetical protein [Rickettsiales bacterium]HCX22731.1 hypothetical protein [Cytophagales bacterium]|tara:strand:+ start:2927 stop:3340 length:414 start_codon:yes stop_codon:yes gene_type:complete